MKQGGRQVLRLTLILVAAFMVVLDFSIVNVALPSIQRELGLSASTVQWVITGYAIAFAGLLVLGGRAADLLGRRRMFIVGLLIFTAASLSGGLAHDPVLLISSRVIQGAGAALVAPSALSLITTSFTEGDQRNRALGMYGATASIGFVAGQVLGGVLVQFTSWRAVFLVNVPVGILAVVLAPRLLANSRGPAGASRLDARGALLITAAMAALVLAVSEVDFTGWLSPIVLGSFAFFVACGAAFIVAERHHPAPLLPAALVRRPALRTAGSLNLLLGLWNGGEMLVLSLYFQQVLKDSPLVTGLVIAPQGVIGFAAGAFGARLARRIGIQRLLVLTCAIAASGFLVLTRLPASGHYSPLFTALMLVGFGTAGTAFGTMVTATQGIAGGEQGVVGGVVNTSRQIGAALGAAALPAIAEAAGRNQQVSASGTSDAMLAAAAAAALGMVIAYHRLRTVRRSVAAGTTVAAAAVTGGASGASGAAVRLDLRAAARPEAGLPASSAGGGVPAAAVAAVAGRGDTGTGEHDDAAPDAGEHGTGGGAGGGRSARRELRPARSRWPAEPGRPRHAASRDAADRHDARDRAHPVPGHPGRDAQPPRSRRRLRRS